jgi:serine/threonine protein kinase
MASLEKDDVVIVDKQYHIVKEIGHGAYAKVYKAKDDSRHHYAIKVIPHTKVGASCLEEASFLSTYSHKNINSAIAVELTNSCLYIVQEYATGGDLAFWVKKRSELPHYHGTESLKLTMHIAQQLFQALAYIHREGVIHADIKPHNILVYWPEDSLGEESPSSSRIKSEITPMPLVKLSDFNLAVKTSWKKTDLVCTDTYRPMEAWRKTKGEWSWNEKVDIWSLGATLYFVLFGMELFRAQENES